MLRLFTEHPASVGETYTEHFQFAWRTGAMMLVGGLGCLVHGVFPFLCVTTGSRTIRALAARLGGAQRRHATIIRHVVAARASKGPHHGPAVVESLTSSAL